MGELCQPFGTKIFCALYKTYKVVYNFFMLILASASPRRKTLLKEIANDFEVVVSTFEENALLLAPKDLATYFAKQKALQVASEHPNDVVIGADTIVVLKDEVLGKPKDDNHARQMLLSLSGKSHVVYTAFCIVGQGKLIENFDKTKVYFKTLSKKDVDDYVATGSPLDKAGAYGIQDCNFVEKIEGSYSNVMGLPQEKIAICLKQFDL